MTENIHYQLDAGCLEGLQLFYRYAAEIGARQAPELHFVETIGAAQTNRASVPIYGKRVNFLSADVPNYKRGIVGGHI